MLTEFRLQKKTIETAKASDAVLMGSIGGDAKTSTLVSIRTVQTPGSRASGNPQSLKSLCEFRPAYLYQELKGACPLKEEVIWGRL